MSLSLTVLERRTTGLAACLMLEYLGKRLLLDCGYDDSQAPAQPFSSFPIPASTLHSVILSHGHLGHCGLLPILVRQGFHGKVYCTRKTREIAIANMQEAALMQDEDARYWKEKMPQNVTEPAYSEAEVLQCKSFFVPCKSHDQVQVGEDVTLRFFRAGHGMGSSFVQISLGKGPQLKKVLYIGDVGSEENDLYLKSVTEVQYDCVFLPAHKDIHEGVCDIRAELAQIINRTCETGGNILIPVFSMDHRNAVLKLIQNLSATHQIPSLFVFIDSPTAGIHSKSLLQNVRRPKKTLALTLIETVDDSKTLNWDEGTVIIIAGSSKGDQGRMQFHLKRNLTRPESAVVLLGEYSHGTIWDQLLCGNRKITILGEEIEANAQIHRLADRAMHLHAAEVVKWLGHLKPAPKRIYVTHGEDKVKTDFQQLLQQHIPCDVRVPTEDQLCD